MVELPGLAQSTVSMHMSVLRQAGLVASRKDGRWVHYRLAPDPAPVNASALRWALDALASDPRNRDDARRLLAILRQHPSELCRRQCA